MGRTTLTIGFLAALLVPAGAAAQQARQVEIMPRVGVYAPRRELGTTAWAEGPWNLRLGRLEAVPVFELLAQLGLPGGHFAVRASALAAAPSVATGYFDCSPGLACPAVLLTSQAETTVFAGVFDIVASPFGTGAALRPYVVAGAGTKHYRYSWQDAAVMVTAGHATERTLVLHTGVGVDIDVFGAPLRLEVSDYWSPRGSEILNQQVMLAIYSRWPAPGRHAQHDLAVSIGYRVALF